MHSPGTLAPSSTTPHRHPIYATTHSSHHYPLYDTILSVSRRSAAHRSRPHASLAWHTSAWRASLSLVAYGATATQYDKRPCARNNQPQATVSRTHTECIHTCPQHARASPSALPSQRPAYNPRSEEAANRTQFAPMRMYYNVRHSATCPPTTITLRSEAYRRSAHVLHGPNTRTHAHLLHRTCLLYTSPSPRDS